MLHGFVEHATYAVGQYNHNLLVSRKSDMLENHRSSAASVMPVTSLGKKDKVALELSARYIPRLKTCKSQRIKVFVQIPLKSALTPWANICISDTPKNSSPKARARLVSTPVN